MSIIIFNYLYLLFHLKKDKKLHCFLLVTTFPYNYIHFHSLSLPKKADCENKQHRRSLHFRVYIKIRHDISSRKIFFFSKILFWSIQKKNQGDVFWEFDLEHICKNSRKKFVVRIS